MKDFASQLLEHANGLRKLAADAEARGQKLLAYTANTLADRCTDAIKLVGFASDGHGAGRAS